MKDFIQITSDEEFNEAAIELFQKQFRENTVYRDYVHAINVKPEDVHSAEDIPCLPISFFKTHIVKTGIWEEEAIFTSSATTSANVSQHFVRSLEVYKLSFEAGFKLFYGEPRSFAILALLPSYLERQGSSLVYMAKELIEQSGNSASGFYLGDYGALIGKLEKLREQGSPTILLGVTFALLELSKQVFSWPELIVMETGGMKGRGPELTREEVHDTLMKSFGVAAIHSEYGMTELLSQAYSNGRGAFTSPPWMKVTIREIQDPLSSAAIGQTGGINVIDLANAHSCAFIATEDLGRLKPDGSFEILGRYDQSDVRGCNLMAL